MFAHLFEENFIFRKQRNSSKKDKKFITKVYLIRLACRIGYQIKLWENKCVWLKGRVFLYPLLGFRTYYLFTEFTSEIQISAINLRQTGKADLV